MNTVDVNKEIEVIKTFKHGRFKVTVCQVKMSDEDREVENSRIRKQFMISQL